MQDGNAQSTKGKLTYKFGKSWSLKLKWMSPQRWEKNVFTAF